MEDHSSSRVWRLATFLCILCAAISIFCLTVCLNTAAKEAKALRDQLNQAITKIDVLAGEMVTMNENLTGVSRLADTLNESVLGFVKKTRHPNLCKK